MASNVFGAKQFKPTAPDKGSFPIDHHGECKEFYLKFMVCMSEKGRMQDMYLVLDFLTRCSRFQTVYLLACTKDFFNLIGFFWPKPNSIF